MPHLCTLLCVCKVVLIPWFSVYVDMIYDDIAVVNGDITCHVPLQFPFVTFPWYMPGSN